MTEHLHSLPFSFNLTHQIYELERWPSGLRRTPGKCVYVNSVPRVRIPLSPPVLKRVMVVDIGPFAAICGEPRQVRKEATVATDSGAEMWLIFTASIL
jgi:hypothetical protein